MMLPSLTPTSTGLGSRCAVRPTAPARSDTGVRRAGVAAIGVGHSTGTGHADPVRASRPTTSPYGPTRSDRPRRATGTPHRSPSRSPIHPEPVGILPATGQHHVRHRPGGPRWTVRRILVTGLRQFNHPGRLGCDHVVVTVEPTPLYVIKHVITLRHRVDAVRDGATVGAGRRVSLGAAQAAYETPRRVAIRRSSAPPAAARVRRRSTATVSLT